MGNLASPIYEALDTDSLQIRLLHLEPCVAGDQVVACRMTTASLSTNLQYHLQSTHVKCSTDRGRFQTA